MVLGSTFLKLGLLEALARPYSFRGGSVDLPHTLEPPAPIRVSMGLGLV